MVLGAIFIVIYGDSHGIEGGQDSMHNSHIFPIIFSVFRNNRTRYHILKIKSPNFVYRYLLILTGSSFLVFIDY